MGEKNVVGYGGSFQNTRWFKMRKDFLFLFAGLLIVCLFFQTGCNKDFKSFSGTSEAADSGVNSANIAGPVSFQIVLPESVVKQTPSNASETEAVEEKLDSSIRAQVADVTPEVTFKLMLVNVGNLITPISTMVKTVPVVNGTAVATFTGVPASTCVGEIKISGGSINSYTDFHGAMDLKVAQQNILTVSPIGSRLHQDFLAYVIKQIVASPVLFGKAVPGLTGMVALSIAGLDGTKATAFDDAVKLFAGFVDVEIVVSTGAIEVPNVIGKARSEAETILTALGLATSVTTANDASIPVGYVISQSPVVWSKLSSGDVVNLVVSLGAATSESFSATPFVGGSYWEGQSLKLSLAIPAGSAQVTKVEFFEGASTKLVEFVTPPYELTIPNISGNKTYTALAMFSTGGSQSFTKTISCKSIMEKVTVILANGTEGTLFPDSSIPSVDTVPPDVATFVITLATEIEMKPETFSLTARRQNNGRQVTVNAENERMKMTHSGKSITVSVKSSGSAYSTLIPGGTYLVSFNSGQVRIAGQAITLRAPSYQFKTANTPYYAFDKTTGTINSFIYNSAVLNPALEIPGTIDGVLVTNIGPYAFNGVGLDYVTIPSSVTSIGAYAFASNKLTSITIPGGIQFIGPDAFRFNQLVRIIIGSGVTIGERMLTTNQSFRDTYYISGAGTYIGTQTGTWTKQ